MISLPLFLIILNFEANFLKIETRCVNRQRRLYHQSCTAHLHLIVYQVLTITHFPVSTLITTIHIGDTVRVALLLFILFTYWVPMLGSRMYYVSKSSLIPLIYSHVLSSVVDETKMPRGVLVDSSVVVVAFVVVAVSAPIVLSLSVASIARCLLLLLLLLLTA